MTTSMAVLSLVVLVLYLFVGGTDDNSSGAAETGVDCASGAISGAGSTFVQTIAQQWAKAYQSACPNAGIDYKGVGSGAGIQQLIAGTVDFGASDVRLKPDEESAAAAKRGPILQIPWVAGGIAVEYKLTGVGVLHLSPATLAGIFAGTVTRWDAPSVRVDNPGASLPSLPIQVVHRSDGSGTTAAFTAYLATVAPEIWKVGSGKDVKWPVGEGAKGSDGVTAAVKAAEGAIGYAEVSYPKANALGIALIQNRSGRYVGPDASAVTSALREARVGSGLDVRLAYEPLDADAYPISTVSYVLVPRSFTDPGKAALVRSFVNYAIGGGQRSTDDLSYAPLPQSLTAPAREAAATIDGSGGR